MKQEWKCRCWIMVHLHGKGHDDGRLYTHRAGDLYDLLAPQEAANPQGEWNHVEIKCSKWSSWIFI